MTSLFHPLQRAIIPIAISTALSNMPQLVLRAIEQGLDQQRPISTANFSKNRKNDAFAQYFIGTSYLSMLSTEGINIGNVVFEPGYHNNSHIHHGSGQI